MDRRQFSAFLITSGFAGTSLAKTNWKLATGYSAQSFHTVNLTTMALDAAAATRGALQIEIHPNNTLVRPPEPARRDAAGRTMPGVSPPTF